MFLNPLTVVLASVYLTPPFPPRKQNPLLDGGLWKRLPPSFPCGYSSAGPSRQTYGAAILLVGTSLGLSAATSTGITRDSANRRVRSRFNKVPLRAGSSILIKRGLRKPSFPVICPGTRTFAHRPASPPKNSSECSALIIDGHRGSLHTPAVDRITNRAETDNAPLRWKVSLLTH